MKLETQQLFHATREGDADEVRRLLALGADANGFYTDTGEEFMPVVEAVQQERADILRLLLEHGADPTPTHYYLDAPLYLAAGLGNVELMRLLLEHGAEVEPYYGGGGCMPLHLAVEKGCRDCVELLLEHGAAWHTTDADGATALHYAAFEHHGALLRRLLGLAVQESGHRDAGVIRVAHAALCGGEEELEALIRAGEDLNAEDGYGYSPLAFCVVAGEVEACARLLRFGANAAWEHNLLMRFAAGYGHVAVAQLLLEHGERLDSTDIDGDTLLHACACNGHAGMARFLLRQGLAVDARNKSGETPLHLAAENGHGELVCTLLEHGAAAEVMDEHGFTPLGHAVCHESMAGAVRMLLERGARVEGKSRMGADALHAAARFNHPEVFELLCTHARAAGMEVDADALMRYRWLHPAHIPFLLTQGATLPEANREQKGNALFRWAKESWEPQLGRELLAAGADPNAANEYGQTPLHMAVQRGDCLCVDMLLRAGANPNVMACDPASPLDYALPDHPECAELLLKYGADIELMGKRRCSSLHVAAMNGCCSTIHWLLEHGARVNRRCYDGRTALEYAEEAGHLKTAQLLREYGAE